MNLLILNLLDHGLDIIGLYTVGCWCWKAGQYWKARTQKV